ncbi:hypothetical protein PCE31106_03939 [Pandoraea cepalis]|uniref:Uncharacterized protein n=1 Tax=Pandoraea cepalis TaxID=2508294 RepID=A0A5E4XLJ6_9BURK|nr:hypothetical protein [Pandoraea cepalis]VVE37164.1 hypothetical protein PCE31106_03939 [Pandoraea cepalis]
MKKQKSKKRVAALAKPKPRGPVMTLKAKLARLQAELIAPKSNQARLLYEIRMVEERLKIERFHRVSKLSSVNMREILCGSPGLGKKS